MVEYSRAELATASPAPTVTISGGAQGNVDQLSGMAFDAAGNLWVSSGRGLFEYSRAALAGSGHPKPEVTIGVSPIAGNGNGPGCLAFDRAGDLWWSSGVVVAELSKAQLGKSAGAVQAELSVNSRIDLNLPCGPTFDRSGDIWVGDSANNIVAEFPKAQVAEWRASGPAPVSLSSATGPCSICNPRVVISGAAISAPGGVAFDRSGNLWVPSAGKNAVLELSRADIAKSGSPAPISTVAGPATRLDSPWAVAFAP